MTEEEVVTIETADGPMDAYVARPAAGAKSPALAVAQEAFGVNDYIRDVCRRFAREGYVALAPELFHRDGRNLEISYDDFPSARGHLAALTNEGLEVDLAAAFGHLAGRPDVLENRIGLVGFCVGGFAAFLGACRLAPAATVAFYGGGIVRPRPQLRIHPVLDEADRITAPVLCLFGADDKGIPPDDVESIRQRFAEIGGGHEVVVYPGAGHAFFCDRRPAFEPNAATDAWRRTLDWLARHVRAELRSSR